MTLAIVPPEITNAILALALAAPRMMVALSLLPFFARQSMTRIMVSAVASVITIPVIPSVMVQMPANMDTFWVMGTILKESAIGLFIGFAVAIPFWAAQAMGDLIDNQRGASMAQISNPSTGEMATPMGLLFNLAFSILFVLSGGLGLLINMVYDSYLAWPVVGWIPSFDSAFPTHMLNMLDRLTALAILFAAPAIIVMLVSELALAFVSLFAPQLQVFFLAMPIKSGVATFILLACLYSIVEAMMSESQHIRDVLPALQSVVR